MRRVDPAQAVQVICREAASWRKHPGVTRGLPTGIGPLDQLTGGLRQGEVTVLGARTSHGKSAFALNVVLNVLRELASQHLATGEPLGCVLYFSPEMSGSSLLQRLASIDSRIPLRRLEDGSATEQEYQTWLRSLQALAAFDQSLVLYDGALELVELQQAILQHVALRETAGIPIRLVVVDYLQRVRVGMLRDLYERLSEISLTLKDLANEYQIPVLALSQLKRDYVVDKRTSQREPEVDDLKGSGNLEEDADNIWLLVREPKEDATTPHLPQEARLYVKKSRNGPVGSINLWFWPALFRFGAPGNLHDARHHGTLPPSLVDLVVAMAQAQTPQDPAPGADEDPPAAPDQSDTLPLETGSPQVDAQPEDAAEAPPEPQLRRSQLGAIAAGWTTTWGITREDLPALLGQIRGPVQGGIPPWITEQVLASWVPPPPAERSSDGG